MLDRLRSTFVSEKGSRIRSILLSAVLKAIMAVCAIIIVYALLWEPVGFLIATPLAMAAMMLLLGYRRYVMIAIFSLGTTLIVFGAFSFFLNVNMPLGILWILM